MSNDRLPLPLQAAYCMFVPGTVAALFFLASTIVTSFEIGPAESRNVWLSLMAVVAVGIGSVLQFRYVQRSIASGMVDRTASAQAVTIATIIGAVIGLAVMPYIAESTPGVRTPWNRNSIGFPAAVMLAAIWVCAWAGLKVQSGAARSQ